MPFNPDMYRTEELHKFQSKGILSGHGQVVIGNAGLAAKYNPIPGMLEHLKDHPCRENYQLVHFTLSGHLQRVMALKGSDAADAATNAIGWFLDPHCHACHGTGLKNFEQEQCPVCNGNPKYPSWPVAEKACREIDSLFAWREVQLRKRMAGSDQKHMPAEYDGEGTHKLNLGRVNGATPACPSADDQSNGMAWGGNNTY